MISSVSYLTNPYKGAPSRSSDKMPRPGSAVAGATEAIERAIDQVDSSAERMGVEAFPHPDERQQAIDPRQSSQSQLSALERDPVAAMTEMLASKATVSANIAVIKTMDRTIGTLIDFFA